MNVKKIVLLLGFIGLARLLSAQVPREDSVRFMALYSSSTALAKRVPDSARVIAMQALELAQKQGHIRWQGKVLNTIGVTWRMETNFAQAMRSYERSLELLQQARDTATLSEVYKNMGDIYRLQSRFPQAIECITQSLSYAEAIGDKRRMADAYVCFSTIYYISSDDYAKAEGYLLKARPLYEAIGHEEGLALVYSNLSLSAVDRGENETALRYIEQCLAIQNKLGDQFGAATSFHNRASTLSNMGRYAEAMADYKQEVAIFEKMGDQEGLSDAYSSIGELFIAQKKYPDAIVACKKSLEQALAIGGNNVSEANACNCLYTTYQKLGDYKQALVFLERLSKVKDSLQQNETAQKLQQMELERDSIEQEKARFGLELEHQQALNKKDKFAGWLIASGAGLLIIALAFWVRMLYFMRRSEQLRARSEYLEKEQLSNEIALLRTQVNPHFLFNSLSILSSLVHVDAHLSEQFIEQLARSYRYILEQKDQSLVTLRTELEFIRAYVFLLKIRFEHKFDLKINLSETDLNRYKIAPLILQLLIENAVKHNRMSANEPLIVEISLTEAQTLLVSNPLRPRHSAPLSTGIGLQNIINRYALLSDRSVWAGERNGDFVVEIPLLTA